MSRNKIFTFGVICAIIFSLSVEVYPEEKAREAPAPNLGAKESIGRAAKIAEEDLKPFQYDPKGRRDPFIPLVNRDGLFFEPAVRKENIVSDIITDNVLSLEGIVYEDGGSSCAIINSEIVQSGDKIGDYQVLEVQRQKVVLGKAEEILELELKKEDE